MSAYGTGSGKDNAFITDLNQRGDDPDNSGSEDAQSQESGEEEKTNQIFNVREAVPPTDFDAPYSKMPPSVEKLMPRVKQKVIESYKPKINYKMIEERKANAEKRNQTKTAKYGSKTIEENKFPEIDPANN